MVQTKEQANDLIFRFYEAAQDRTLLPAFMCAIANHFHAHIAGLRLHDSGYAGGKYFETFGLPIQTLSDLEGQLVHGHPWRKQGFIDMLTNGVGHSGTIVPVGKLERTEFHSVVLKPTDIRHGMGIAFWTLPPNQMAVLSINRPKKQGAFREEELRFAKSMLPHFRSAYAIMRRISWLEAKTSSLASAIERMNVGFVLTDESGRCTYCNEAADGILSSKHGLTLSALGALRCTDFATQRQLNDAIRLAAAGDLSSPRRIHVRELDGKVACILVVTMLRGNLALGPMGAAASVAVFIHSPSSVVKDPAIILQETFGLTPAVARLAVLLASGNRLGRCAEILNLAMPTVRSQIRELFAKAGINRQAELIPVLQFALRAE